MSRCYLLIGLLMLSGCGEKKVEDAGLSAEGDQIGKSAALTNGLAGHKGELYRSQSGSKIAWQPWRQESFDLAKEMDRLVLGLVVMPQHMEYVEILGEMESSRAVVSGMNDHYVPILIDAGVCREWIPFGLNLCVEINTPARFPLLVWMSPAGHPVAWITLGGGSGESNLNNLFMGSHEMVHRLYQEDSGYIMRNSRLDHENRRERVDDLWKKRGLGVSESGDDIRAMRQLTTLYDRFTGNFDQSGELFPTGTIDLLSYGVLAKHGSEDERKRAMEVLDDLINHLISSAMFDPLDGGVFTSRTGDAWDLPRFHRGCEFQARVVCSLVAAYEAGGNTAVIERARGVLAYAEESYRVGDGLYANGVARKIKVNDWLWSWDDVAALLNEDEMDIWSLATGMRETGNIPIETDPDRKHKNLNALGHKMSAAEIAEKTGRDLSEVGTLLESARKKMLEERMKRTGEIEKSRDAEANATFRMVSAYAAMFRATGEEAYREKVVGIMTKASEEFRKGLMLSVYPWEEGEEPVRARAFAYGLAILAALDVFAITQNDEWLVWAEDLLTVVGERFVGENHIRECWEEDNMTGLSLSDGAMFFEETTEGLFSVILARAGELGIAVLEDFGRVNRVMPLNALMNPIIHTDVILGSMRREYGERIAYGSDVTEDMVDLLKRVSPMRATVVSGKRLGNESISGVVKRTRDGSEERLEKSDGLFLPYLREGLGDE